MSADRSKGWVWYNTYRRKGMQQFRSLKRKPQASRSIRFEVCGPFEGNPEAELAKALREGIINVHDGNSQFVWFCGTPGKQLRQLRNRIIAMRREP
jgi:hypothetical protein